MTYYGGEQITQSRFDELVSHVNLASVNDFQGASVVLNKDMYSFIEQ